MDKGNELSLLKAVLIFFMAALVIMIAGIQVGKVFFWDQYQTINPVDKDIQYLQQAVQQEKNRMNDGLLVQLGWAYYQKGAYSEALVPLNKAVAINKINPAAHYNLGLAYQELRQLNKAETEYRRTLELDPKSQYAYYSLGKLYFDQGKFGEAIAQLKLATQYNPVSADNYYWLGQAYEKTGSKDEAISAYQKVLEMVPNHNQAKEAYYRLK